MSGTQQEDSGKMSDCQLKFLRSLSAVLSEHHQVLPTLPIMCERFITAQANVLKEPYEKSNFELSREDEKAVLAKKKRGDLYKHFEEKLAQKDESIAFLEDKLKEEKKFLEKTLSEKDKDFKELLSHYATFRKESKSSNEEYMGKLRAKEEELEESRKRVASLKTELKSKDVVSTMARFKQMERDYQAAISESDEELEKLRQSVEGQEDSERFEMMKRQYQAAILERDEELNKQRDSFNQMEEHYKSVISAKDKELNTSKYSVEGQEDSERFEMMKRQYQAAILERDEELNKQRDRMKELTGKCRALLETKDEELKEVKMRLAQLSEKQMKKDQTKIEDTTAANRPSEVEYDYHEFFDNERMDAIEKMQETYGSEEVNDIDISYPRLACMILEAAYEQTLEAKESALHVFKEIINDMIDRAPRLGAEHSSADKNKELPHTVSFKVSACSQELKYPTEVLDALALSLKETAQLCSLESMETGVWLKIKDKWLSWLKSEKSCKFSFSDRLLIHLKDYVQACLRLTWRMAMQVPPMKLEYRCTTIKNFHRKVGYHSGPEMCSRPSPKRQGAADKEIACYLWPTLLDGGGRVIQPGEVLCKVEAEAI